jgi:18S rRNA (guanine1575-N7)-methyltransferase
MSRPEDVNAPELFYNADEAVKYHSSSRIINIQKQIAERCLDMLSLPAGRPSYVLDIGCGSGLSGAVLEEAGHYWVGSDISADMLAVASEQTDTDTGDLVHSDMGQGLSFRPGSFDGCISVSALQWLCYSNSADQDPKLRLNRFFSSLYAVLKKDARAILQFYPENAEQTVLIAQCASKVGFAGGVLVDYPNSSKAKKYYLCLSFERSYQMPAPMGVGNANTNNNTNNNNNNANSEFAGPEGTVDVVGRANVNQLKKQRREKKPSRPSVKSTDWIKAKKDKHRRQGKEVKTDSKFSGRRRPAAF